MRSAPSGRILTFDPPFDPPGSVLSNALRISAVRHIWELADPCFRKAAWVRIVIQAPSGTKLYGVRPTRTATPAAAWARRLPCEDPLFSFEISTRIKRRKSAPVRPHFQVSHPLMNLRLSFPKIRRKSRFCAKVKVSAHLLLFTTALRILSRLTWDSAVSRKVSAIAESHLSLENILSAVL